MICSTRIQIEAQYQLKSLIHIAIDWIKWLVRGIGGFPFCFYLIQISIPFFQPHCPTLSGIIPGLGRFDPCPWGLGCEIRGGKTPHWTGTANSPATFGHFGGAGTLLWVDPVHAVAAVALTDRPFDEWSATALEVWPQFADAVLHEVAALPGAPG